jgi:hypothetical protein
LSNQGLNRQGGRLPGADTALARAEAIAERLATARPESLPYRRQLAVARINHGESLLADGRFDQAESAFDAAI